MNIVHTIAQPIVLRLAVLAVAMSCATEVRAQECVNQMLGLGEAAGYLAVPSSTSLRIEGGLTVEVWAKADAVIERTGLIEKTNDAGRVNYSLVLGPDNTIVGRIVTVGGAISHSTPPIQNLTQWHHYAMVFRPGDSLYLYVDGKRTYPAKKVSASLLQSGTDSLRIGTSVQPGGGHFVGSLDEVRIWRIARTDNDIELEYRRVLTPETALPELAAYYTFDDVPSSRKIYDFARRNNNGHLKQSTTIVTSTTPVVGVARAFKLQAKEQAVILRTEPCRTTYDTTVNIRNLGLDSINVNSLGLIYGKAFSIAGPERLELPADSSFYGAIRIQFNPTQAGAGAGPKYLDTLIITSNEYCAGTLKIPLEAEYHRTGIDLNTQSLSFESVLNCELPSSPTTIRLRNLGSQPATIVETSFTAPLGVTITFPDPTLPFTIPAGGSQEVGLRVDPAAEGRVEGTLLFRSSLCDETAALSIVVNRQDITYTMPSSQTFADRIIRDQVAEFDTVIPFVNRSARAILIQRAEMSFGSAFSLLDPVYNLVVQPGDTAFIPVHFSTTGCDTYSGTLRLFGSPCGIQPKTELRVSVVSQPLDAVQTFDAGFFCSTLDTAILIRNPFDRTITVRDPVITPPQRAKISEAFTFPFTLSPDSTVSLPVRFTAGTAGELGATLSLFHELCGKTAVALVGSVGTTQVRYASATLNFGQGCDTTLTRRSVWLYNPTSHALPLFNPTITGSDRFFLASALPSILPAHDSVSIEIVYRPRLGSIEQAAFVLQASQGCTLSPLMLRGSRELPNISALQSTLAFDTICPGTFRDLNVELINDGLDSVQLSGTLISGSNAFTVIGSSTLLPPGKSSVTVRFLPGALAEYTGNLTVVFADCRDPLIIGLSGSGGSAPTLALSTAELDFGDVDVQRTKTACLELTNPSCAPITVSVESFVDLPEDVGLANSTVIQLPKTLLKGERFEVCLEYLPTSAIVLDRELKIHASPADTVYLRLRGQGLAPDVVFDPTLVDFGYVLVGQERTAQVLFTNHGNRDAAVALRFVAPTTQYSLINPALVVAPGTTTPLDIVFAPTAPALHEAQIAVEHMGRVDTIHVRGVGAEKGISLEVTQIDFGPVRVGTTAERILRVSSNFQPLTLDSVKPADVVSGFEVVDAQAVLPVTFTATDDAIELVIRFSPTEEHPVFSSLLFWTDNKKLVSLPVVGIGVEAHLEIEPELDFGVQQIEELATTTIRVHNPGGFPLKIISASPTPPFTIGSLPDAIAPSSSIDVEVSFVPLTTKEIVGRLILTADAPESPDTVILRGRGGDLPQGNPRLAYSLPDSVKAVIGETILIPVSLGGNKLEDLRLNSFDIVIHHDPSMLHFVAAQTFGTLAHGFSVAMERISDSVVRYVGSGPELVPSTSRPLIYLVAEGLLGPQEQSTLRVVQARPGSASSLNDASSIVTVQNCKDQPVSVTYKGEYDVSAPTPFPMRDRAEIRYTLGLPGMVTIDAYDNLGRPIARVYEASKPKGEHRAHLDLSSLRAGHYTYVFRSLEYVTRGTLLIER